MCEHEVSRSAEDHRHVAGDRPYAVPEHEQLSNTLHHVLSRTTKGKALRIVQNIDEGCSYLAWWKLRVEMEPRAQTRALGILTSLLSVRFTEESRI